MSRYQTTDFECDPPRGRKRYRDEDTCIVEQGQQYQQLWEEEIATEDFMTGRNRRGGRGRGAETSRDSLSQTPFTDRPILQPTAPSKLLERSRSRSQSPVRQTILAMETGHPPVKLNKGSAPGSVPESVGNLVEALIQNAGCAIPASVRNEFETYDPATARQMSESAFSTDAQLYNWRNDVKAGWARVQDIHRRAAKCDRRCMDESAWCDVVRLVLELALDVAGDVDEHFALEINNVQSQALDSAFLPRTIKNGGGMRSIDRKIYFALAVDTEKGSHLAADPEQVPASPMMDAYTERVPLVCGLEVKRPGGDEEEAPLQLMVWDAAMLAHLEALHRPRRKGDSSDIPLTDDVPLPPVVGWTVKGHTWQFYVAWKEPSGEVHVLRPFTAASPASNTSTGDTASIFILLKILVELIRWFKSHYYPVYQALFGRAIEREITAASLLDT
jgi:hypothetical protein